jgi:hypothetical protein
MCHQTVGLVASCIERLGIPTVSLSLLRSVTEKVRPPRTLIVPFRFGYPLGKARDAGLQRKVIRAALSLLDSPDPLPILRDFELD